MPPGADENEFVSYFPLTYSQIPTTMQTLLLHHHTVGNDQSLLHLLKT